MRVVSAPPIQFCCTGCKATNEGEAGEFKEQHTMPPTWIAKCAFCGAENRVAPQALLSRAATAYAQMHFGYR